MNLSHPPALRSQSNWSSSLLHHRLEYTNMWDVTKDSSLRKSYSKTHVNKALCSWISRWKVRKNIPKDTSFWDLLLWARTQILWGKTELQMRSHLPSAPKGWKTSLWVSSEELECWVGSSHNQIISKKASGRAAGQLLGCFERQEACLEEWAVCAEKQSSASESWQSGSSSSKPNWTKLLKDLIWGQTYIPACS